ncbi:TPA: PTS beta-glucoside transporter subunit IIBCA [Enterococcus faecalis]|nr:PTS beta-glucoside transporter subunit IIBCA [Enterococcus faecalis]
MAENYQQAAKDIIQLIGMDNIISVTHCQTRLRFILKDHEQVDGKQLEKIDLVKGVFYNGGQYQVILGTGIVTKVYDEIEKLGINVVSKAEQTAILKNNETGMRKTMRILSEIFIPIVPVIAATGLFLGLKGVIFNDTFLQLFGASVTNIPESFQQIVSVITDTVFAFLPALIVWSTFKAFNATPVIGIVIGLMMVSPILPNAYAVATPDSGVKAIMAFGFIPVVGAQGSVLSAIAAGIIGAKIELFFRKKMPNILDQIFTPFMTMLITFLIMILGIGPILHTVELGMVDVVQWLIGLPLGLGGFVIGASYPLMVLIGIHHTLTMVETSLLANTGFNALITICAMYGFANVGSCLAFAKKAQDSKVKSTAIGSMLSQLFGVSEPVLFGLLIRWNLKPLLCVLFTSGLGGAILAIFHIQSNSYGLAVIPSFLMYIYSAHQLVIYLLVALLSVGVCYALTSLFAIPQEVLISDKVIEEEEREVFEMQHNTLDEQLFSPVTGYTMNLTAVNDPVFSSEMMGKGLAIMPTANKVYAPADGLLNLVADTGHAYGIQTDAGAEVLIHIGIDTVTLGQEVFQTQVTQGHRVKKGDLLGTFDRKAIKEAGLDSTVMVIITNTSSYLSVEPMMSDYNEITPEQIILNLNTPN